MKTENLNDESVARTRAMLVARGVAGAATADPQALVCMAAAAEMQDQTARLRAARQTKQEPHAKRSYGWATIISSIDGRATPPDAERTAGQALPWSQVLADLGIARRRTSSDRTEGNRCAS